MNITELSIHQLKPYEKNPRKNDAAVDAVANSIKEFGFKVPIVIDSDYVIVAGHTRFKAAQKIGLNKVPCVIADDLTPEQVRAFRLADNKTAELADWDDKLLELELADITIDMSQFGFENVNPQEDLEAQEDTFDTTPDESESRAEYGSLWQLGRHRMMVGDSTKQSDVRQLMGGGKGGCACYGSTI